MRYLALLSLSFLLINPRSEATPLNLTAGLPDFIASSLNVNYVPGSNRLAAAGLTTGYQGGSVSLLNPGSYDLEAFINSSGHLNFGFLTISGDIGSGPETLLTGNLNTGPSGTAFGFQGPPGGNIFEFLFTVTGGDPIVVSDFGGLGAPNRGVILNAEFQNGGTPFNGTWTSGFHNDGHSGVDDNFVPVVPEPGSLVLLMLGGGAWVSGRPRSRLNKGAKALTADCADAADKEKQIRVIRAIRG